MYGSSEKLNTEKCSLDSFVRFKHSCPDEFQLPEWISVSDSFRQVVRMFVQGLKNMNKTARDLLISIQKVDGDNYPEVISDRTCVCCSWNFLVRPKLLALQTLHRLLVINAGSGFKTVWYTAKQFVDPGTVQKIQVCLGQTLSVLLLPVGGAHEKN